MVEIHSERGENIWIFTDKKYEKQIDDFIKTNYGKVVLCAYSMSNASPSGIEIVFPAHAVGLDVLILFVADLEYDDTDITPEAH